ncbi:MAG: sel1 repeat family protein [Bacteroides sp.]|nr:sel1 repeat family protein [Bacteroides sp.]
MKIKQFLMLVLLIAGSAFSLAAQDASFYKKYAEKGDKEAMYNLAECYLNGSGGVTEDMNQVTFWLTKAAKKNYAPAQVKLAYCYLFGTGVLKDYKQAWELVQKAVKQDNADALYLTASMYKDGLYVN